MSDDRLEQLRNIAEREPDDALAQYGFGKACLAAGRYDEGIAALARALLINPNYSAAHRDLGRAYLESKRPTQAIKAFRRGIPIAEREGDLQTVREMQVFMKRATRQLKR